MNESDTRVWFNMWPDWFTTGDSLSIPKTSASQSILLGVDLNVGLSTMVSKLGYNLNLSAFFRLSFGVVDYYSKISSATVEGATYKFRGSSRNGIPSYYTGKEYAIFIR